MARLFMKGETEAEVGPGSGSPGTSPVPVLYKSTALPQSLAKLALKFRPECGVPFVAACALGRSGGSPSAKAGMRCQVPSSFPQLNRPASLGEAVAVASLPQQGQSLSQGTQCLAMGWGRLGTRAPTPRVLQELNVTVVTFLCRDHNVCTLVPRRAAGICFVSAGLARGGGARGGEGPVEGRGLRRSLWWGGVYGGVYGGGA